MPPFPTISIGSTNWGSSVNSYWSELNNVFSSIAANISPFTVLAQPLTTIASATTSSGFNLPPGSAPTSPNNGDMWTTSTGLFVRIAGTTVGPLGTGGGGITGSGSANQFAYWTGTSALAGTSGLTYSLVSGATLISNVVGTSTATTATSGFSQSVTFTGAASGTFSGISTAVSITPGGASSAFYVGLASNPVVTSAANANLSAANVSGGSFTPIFNTANTTGATVLAGLSGLFVSPSVITTNATGTNTIGAVYGLSIAPGTFSSTGGGGMTITTYYGLYLGTLTLSTMTVGNRYGIYQTDSLGFNFFNGAMNIAYSSSSLTPSYSLVINPTFSGALSSTSAEGLNVVTTAAPGSATSGAFYYGAYIVATCSSAANTFLGTAAITAGFFQPTFATSNTSGATVLSNLNGVLVYPIISSTNASGTNTITNVYAINVGPPTWTSTGGGGLTITNYYGIYLGSLTLTTTTVTNRYGVYQADTAALNYFGGNLLVTGGIADNHITSSSFSTGGNTTIANGVFTLLNTNSATIATYTVKMPAAPAAGQMVRFVSYGIITALTVSANTSQTMGTTNTATTIAAGTSIEYVFSGTIWYRVR